MDDNVLCGRKRSSEEYDQREYDIAIKAIRVYSNRIRTLRDQVTMLQTQARIFKETHLFFFDGSGTDDEQTFTKMTEDCDKAVREIMRLNGLMQFHKDLARLKADALIESARR